MKSLQNAKNILVFVVTSILLTACGSQSTTSVNSFKSSATKDPYSFNGTLLAFNTTARKFLGLASAGMICESVLLTAAHNTPFFKSGDVYFCPNQNLDKSYFQRFDARELREFMANAGCGKVESFDVSPHYSSISTNFSVVQGFLVSDIAVVKIQPIDSAERSFPKLARSSTPTGHDQITVHDRTSLQRMKRFFNTTFHKMTSNQYQNALISEVDQLVVAGDSGALLTREQNGEIFVQGITSGYYAPYGRLSGSLKSYFSSVPENAGWISEIASNMGCNLR